MAKPPTTKRFVAVGECMVEMSQTETPGLFAIAFAGDTFNTAWYLKRDLSAEWLVDYVTAIGTDDLSQRLLEFIGAAGIGATYIQTLPDATLGLYLIQLQNGERSFTYWRGQSAARRLAQDRDALFEALSGAGLLYLSGITLAILDGSGRANLFDAVAKAREGGAVVAFDPNLRPRLWPDTATMCDTVTKAARLADIILPSHDDEATHFGDRSLEETAYRYAAAGAELVVVKNGGGRMLTLGPDGLTFHSPAKVEKPVDSTAAGDSFNAGFLSAWAQGRSVPDAVRAGATLAARVIRQHGALIS